MQLSSVIPVTTGLAYCKAFLNIGCPTHPNSVPILHPLCLSLYWVLLTPQVIVLGAPITPTHIGCLLHPNSLPYLYSHYWVLTSPHVIILGVKPPQVVNGCP